MQDTSIADELEGTSQEARLIDLFELVHDGADEHVGIADFGVQMACLVMIEPVDLPVFDVVCVMLATGSTDGTVGNICSDDALEVAREELRLATVATPEVKQWKFSVQPAGEVWPIEAYAVFRGNVPHYAEARVIDVGPVPLPVG